MPTAEQGHDGDELARSKMELEAKSKLLATELETGMQRDFEIRRLSAQSELMGKELETAKRTMMAKNRELEQRLLEDQVPCPLWC